MLLRCFSETLPLPLVVCYVNIPEYHKNSPLRSSSLREHHSFFQGLGENSLLHVFLCRDVLFFTVVNILLWSFTKRLFFVRSYRVAVMFQHGRAEQLCIFFLTRGQKVSVAFVATSKVSGKLKISCVSTLNK